MTRAGGALWHNGLMQISRAPITSFRLQPGVEIAGKYQVTGFLGAGWEGEVYLVREMFTGIDRTAKFFFPQRNPRDRALRECAQRLHALRSCPIIIQYHARETFDYFGQGVSILVSDFVDGELLSDFLKRQPGGRLSPFQGLHLLHALASGIGLIHAIGEYHGDLHPENVIIQRHGLGFDLKVLDIFHWPAPRRENIRYDVQCLIRILYDALGGQKRYAKHPPEIKSICRGLRKDLIFRKFRNARDIKSYLETMQWSSASR